MVVVMMMVGVDAGLDVVGHEVTALVRDKQKAALVAGRGGRPVVGTLAEPASYGDLDAQVADELLHA